MRLFDSVFKISKFEEVPSILDKFVWENYL